MSKNDDRILELKKQIEEKKTTLMEKNTKFSPETNCILILDGTTYNLNVLNDESLTFLKIQLYTYKMAVIDMKITDFKISGYSLDDWISDINKKLEIHEIKQKQNELKAMEAKLDKLLSEDKKTELELDDIAALLKM
ncbi:hypothetical protein [Eubacterium ramulus]|uniref:hypothetical protein n=1 Tax=Eubacterium ramulus TaxID=39490 RepID=UPI003999FBB8